MIRFGVACCGVAHRHSTSQRLITNSTVFLFFRSIHSSVFVSSRHKLSISTVDKNDWRRLNILDKIAFIRYSKLRRGKSINAMFMNKWWNILCLHIKFSHQASEFYFVFRFSIRFAKSSTKLVRCDTLPWSPQRPNASSMTNVFRFDLYVFFLLTQISWRGNLAFINWPRPLAIRMSSFQSLPIRIYWFNLRFLSSASQFNARVVRSHTYSWWSDDDGRHKKMT